MFKLAGTSLRFSTAYHPQSDGQIDVLSRGLETYSSPLKCWFSFLSWAELSYNTPYHTAAKITPFQLVYGREPPALLQFQKGPTTNGSLEQLLRERDALLIQIRRHLTRAHDIMKNNADKGRRDLTFAVGGIVFLKLNQQWQKGFVRKWLQNLVVLSG